jgi:hypothetical protein
MNRERADSLLKKLETDAKKDADDCRRRGNRGMAFMFDDDAHAIRELRAKVAFLFADEARLDWIGTLGRFKYIAPPGVKGDVRASIDGLRDKWRQTHGNETGRK